MILKPAIHPGIRKILSGAGIGAASSFPDREESSNLKRLLSEQGATPEFALQKLVDLAESSEMDSVKLGATKIILELNGCTPEEGASKQAIVINVINGDNANVMSLIMPTA